MKVSKKSPKENDSKEDEPTSSARDRTQIATRLDSEIYRMVAEAAAANHHSVSAEVARRVALSFVAHRTEPDDGLQDFERDLMLSFKAGGLRMKQSLGMKAVSEAGPPAREWMNDPSSYTEAASRALEAIADYHPKPTYGYCRLMVYAFRVRLNLRWHALLNEADEEERKKLLEHADAMAREMTLPSPFDPFPKLRSEKDED